MKEELIKEELALELIKPLKEGFVRFFSFAINPKTEEILGRIEKRGLNYDDCLKMIEEFIKELKLKEAGK